MSKNILIFTSHPDDDICGMGGAIMKYIEDGKSIIEIIFTKGESSHPHLKKEVITEIRKKEIEKVAQKIGIKELIHLNLRDLRLKEDIKKYKIKNKIKSLILKYNPERIFTLASSETHPDHRVVNKVVLAAVDSLKINYPVYTFNIWTTPKIQNNPIIYVDISNYFWKKIKMMKQHKSQWYIMYYQQILPVIFRARYYGYKNKCRYAEKFEKVR